MAATSNCQNLPFGSKNEIATKFCQLIVRTPARFFSRGAALRARPGVQKGLGAPALAFLRPRIILAAAAHQSISCGRPAGFARPPVVAFSVMVFCGRPQRFLHVLHPGYPPGRYPPPDTWVQLVHCRQRQKRYITSYKSCSHPDVTPGKVY